MSIGLTDTHCHLNHADFDADRAEAVARALDTGITRLLVIGYDLASSRFALQLADEFPPIQAVIGIHPESALEWTDDVKTEFKEHARRSRDRIAAWGEIGLDYHWETSPHDVQQRVFEEQIEGAREFDLAAVIHCRDAYADVIDTLARLNFRKAVLHCFTGTADEARRAVDLGLYIGVGGIATFKKSDALRTLIADVPIERILLETDSPYLAPQPWRGRRNEPSYLRAVAETLSTIRQMPLDDLIAQTSRNADALFGDFPQRANTQIPSTPQSI